MCGWQERAAGLEAVDGMLAAFGGRIGPNVGDLMGALKVCSSSAPYADLIGYTVGRTPRVMADELGSSYIIFGYHRRRPIHRSNHAAQGRLADSNRNLGVRALLLLGALGRAMGPAVERAARQCLAPALACLADKKKPVRGPRDWGDTVAFVRSCCLLLHLSSRCT